MNVVSCNGEVATGNRELIERFKRKTAATLARIWGSHRRPSMSDRPERPQTVEGRFLR
jgi:hypothetical protein